MLKRLIAITQCLAIAIIGLVIAIASVSISAAQTPLTADAAYAQVQAGALVLIDIRRPSEWRQTGVAESALAISMHQPDFLDNLTTALDGDLTQNVAFICAAGGRSGYITQRLSAMGLPNLFDVREGMTGGPHGQGWIASDLPVANYVVDQSN